MDPGIVHIEGSCIYSSSTPLKKEYMRVIIIKLILYLNRRI